MILDKSFTLIAERWLCSQHWDDANYRAPSSSVLSLARLLEGVDMQARADVLGDIKKGMEQGLKAAFQK